MQPKNYKKPCNANGIAGLLIQNITYQAILSCRFLYRLLNEILVPFKYIPPHILHYQQKHLYHCIDL